ncbi:conserved phage C-terminal domain-containing protein [Mesobacillus zeae]|uniref:Replication protein n=1 Tax=Mesobacillus zeae TaxID=1917180 RepID=A0A398B6S7_9BACI|nr:conserved phage C-terminal domain-containing protein [Mesobacillus zeae]RID85645.1 replication protein [Mesobacillus zeae]
MAKYRQVHVEYWQDGFVLDLTPEEKYFYIYLMTNSKTSQCGIYELPKRIIETETGYNRETVEKLLQRFIDYGKISYSDRTREIMLKNWINYNFINSPKVINCIEKELEKVKEQQFANDYRIAAKRLGYGIDTVCIDSGEEREEEREEEEKKNNIPFVEIVTYLNDVAKTSYRSTSKKTQSLIKARINEGFTLDDFKAVIDIKTAEWLTDSKMVKFLRPETLFGTKFESYLNQKGGSYDQPQFNIPEDGDKYNFGF